MPSPARIPALPLEPICQILRLGPLRTVLRALCVSRQWRTAAETVLQTHRALHLTPLFRPTSRTSSPFIPRHLAFTLRHFQSLHRLHIHHFPHPPQLPELLLRLRPRILPKLSHVLFAHTPVTTAMLLHLLLNFPSLKALSLSHHSSIAPSLCGAERAIALRAMSHPLPIPRLQSLTITHCFIAFSLIQRLLAPLFCQSLRIAHNPETHPLRMSCRIHRHLLRVSGLQTTLVKSLALVDCQLRSLRYCRFEHDPDVEHLNLSGCESMRQFTIEVFSAGDSSPLSMKTLNFARCYRLLKIVSYSYNVTFAALEELVLFGCRNLHKSSLEDAFSLHHECTMPRLRRLDLNGTQIETLRLKEYRRLVAVDVSGCRKLRSVVVKACWALQLFVIMGKYIDVKFVDLSVQNGCQVTGHVVKRWQLQHAAKARRYYYRDLGNVV